MLTPLANMLTPLANTLTPLANMLTELAPSYRRACVRSSRETGRPPLRGSKPPSPHREPTPGPEASRRSDLGSRLLLPFWNKKLKKEQSGDSERKQLRSRANTAEPQRLRSFAPTRQRRLQARRATAARGRSPPRLQSKPDSLSQIMCFKCILNIFG